MKLRNRLIAIMIGSIFTYAAVYFFYEAGRGGVSNGTEIFFGISLIILAFSSFFAALGSDSVMENGEIGTIIAVYGTPPRKKRPQSPRSKFVIRVVNIKTGAFKKDVVISDNDLETGYAFASMVFPIDTVVIKTKDKITVYNAPPAVRSRIETAHNLAVSEQ